MKQEKRKLEMIITSCEKCPCKYDPEDVYDPSTCRHEYSKYMETDIITHSRKIKEDCPLTKIEE